MLEPPGRSMGFPIPDLPPPLPLAGASLFLHTLEGRGLKLERRPVNLHDGPFIEP